MNPPGQWANDRGLTKGSRHQCIRWEIIKGTCPPVRFTFQDINLEGWEEACF
jgi:hypothetical protein